MRMFGKLIDAIRKWHDQRLTIDALARLSDDQLSDIGLNRGTLREVFSSRLR